MKTVGLLMALFGDLLIRFSPRAEPLTGFAFIVHPRSQSDILKKYPFLRYFPNWIIDSIMRRLWPVTVSRISGLKSIAGEEVCGFVISIPLTARQMLEHRSAAVAAVRAAIDLGKARGVKMFGLGGLTSSVTKGGMDLLDIPEIVLTTGHAYTGVNVTRNVFEIIKRRQQAVDQQTIAIVGAAGSIGSISAQILARAGVQRLILIDLERKKELVEALIPELMRLQPLLCIETTHHLSDLKKAHYIIAATNAPEALIHADDLSPGAVVVDDAQPSDVADDVLERSDVLAIEAGVVHTPGISVNFDMGLKNRYDNFCCLAELLILASRSYSTHYVINRPSLAHVDEIAAWGDALGFKIAKFQNRKAMLEREHLQRCGVQ
ncbi:hypothetical protein KGO06_00485 [Patescibacteria group bacterium]|nr:hypothetical protein [Patescibacteria group bacterium]